MCFQTRQNRSDEYGVKVDKLPGNAYKMSIPVKDVEQTSQAMKFHVRVLDLLTFGNTNTNYLQGTGEEGCVNASYSVQQIHHQDKGTRIIVHNYTIKSVSDRKTVYSVSSHGGRLNYEVTVSVGGERSIFGKSLLIIETSPLGKQGEPSMILLCCVFLCLAPLFKVLFKKLVNSRMKQMCKLVQNFVNTFKTTDMQTT